MHPITRKDHNAGKFCANCMAEPGHNRLMVCGRCQDARYCSKACQKANWKVHKPTCNNVVDTRASVHPHKLGEYISLTKVLGKWSNRWDFIVRRWARIGIALLTSNNSPGRAGKYGCVVRINRRPNPPNSSRAFMMSSAKILKNEDLLRLLFFELQQTRKEFERTELTLTRAPNMMILVIICEGLVNTYHVPLREIPTPYNLTNNSKAIIAKKWEEDFISHIESGEVSGKHSDRHFKRFFEKIFPDFDVRSIWAEAEGISVT